jgi:hypothetical protein
MHVHCRVLLKSCYEYKSQFKEYQLTFDNKNTAFNYQMNSRRHTRVVASCYLKNTFHNKVNFIYSQPWEIDDGFNYYTEFKLRLFRTALV